MLKCLSYRLWVYIPYCHNFNISILPLKLVMMIFVNEALEPFEHGSLDKVFHK